jgi:hypothetical protein
MDKLLALGLLAISIVLLVAHFSDIKQTHKNG